MPFVTENENCFIWNNLEAGRNYNIKKKFLNNVMCLAIVNSAAINIGEHVSFWINLGHGYMSVCVVIIYSTDILYILFLVWNIPQSIFFSMTTFQLNFMIGSIRKTLVPYEVDTSISGKKKKIRSFHNMMVLKKGSLISSLSRPLSCCPAVISYLSTSSPCGF